MAICDHLAPNGEKSILYQSLQQEYGDDKAHDIWEATHTFQFENKFPLKEITELDANGEPTAAFVKEKLNLPPGPQRGIILRPGGSEEHFDQYEEIKREQKTISLEPTQFHGTNNRESEESLQKRLVAVYDQAKSNPDTDFIMDYKAIGVNRRYNSGYKAAELANIFDAVGDPPPNVIFPDHLKGLMMNSSRRIMEALRTDAPRELLNRNEEYITNDLNRILLPKKGEDGSLQGYFTTAQHADIVKTALYSTQQLLAKDPTFGANAIVKTFDNFRKIAQARGGNFGYIHEQRVRIADDLLNQMADYGFSVTDKNRRLILQAVDNLSLMHGIDAKLEDAVPTYVEDTQVLLDENKEFAEALGKGLADWGEVSFQHDYKETASGRLKMFLASQIDMDRGVYSVNEKGVHVESYDLKDDAAMRKLAESVNRKGVWAGDEESSNRLVQELTNRFPTLPNKTFLGTYKLVDFESLYSNILEEVADLPFHDLDKYLDKLVESGQPNLVATAQAVKAADVSIQNEFAKIMAVQYDDFIIGLHSKTIDETTLDDNFQLKVKHSNNSSQKNTLIDGWREAQKISEIVVKNAAEERVINTERAEKWVSAMAKFRSVDLTPGLGNYEASKKYVRDMLRISGIELTEDMMDDLAFNTERYTKGTSYSGGWERQFSTTENGQPNGMFTAFAMKMAGKYGEQDVDSMENSDLESKLQMNNPLYTESTTMRILANIVAKHTDQLHSGSARNVEGKTVWNFSMHSSLSRQFLNLKEDFWTFRDRFNKVDFAQNNLLLKTLMDQPRYMDRIRLSYLDGLKGAWQKRGVTRSQMSDREQALMSMLLYQNRGEGFKKVPEVHYMSLTHADKTTTPIMFNMPKIAVGNSKFTPDTVVGKTTSAFYKVFQSEWQRIVNQKNIDYNDSRYNKGKELFYQIPEFNYDYMKKAVENKQLDKKEFETLWVGGKRTLTETIGPRELEVVNKILRKTINDRINTTKDLWTREGLLGTDNFMFDKKYAAQLMRIEGITYDEQTKGYKNRERGNISKEEMTATIGHLAAKDYALNNFLHNTSMAQLFFGDPAITHKNGANDFERVKATMDDYGKRLAKDIAPGLEPLFAPEDRKFVSLVLKDLIIHEKYLDFMGDAYKKVNSTDAQELTTMEEHLKVMHALGGLISDRMYNDMMQIIKAGKGGFYEFTNPEHLALIMNPMKPVFSALRTEKDGAMLADYVKSSSYPLYPPATAGTHMDGIRLLMEKNDIARAPFESGKKTGSPTEPLEVLDDSGKFVEPHPDILARATQILDRSGFRIQQDVPYDEDKDSIKTVSQENKLIHEGIEHITDFKIPGIEGTKTGKEVREIKETVRKNMIGDQYQDFNKEWNIQSDRIQDTSIVYDKLARLADQKRFTPNEVNSLLMRDADGNLHIPLMFNTASDKFESMLMAMVKDISQVSMPGKSYVQASAAGWKFNEDADLSNSKIVWSSSYDGSGLKTMRKGDGESLPAQILVPASFLGSDVRAEDVMIIRNGRREIDESKVPKELLQLIGARIPNQGHSSMSAMEVVGILPKNMGDIVVVPAGFTKQMGADFDVDKLYTYRRAFAKNMQRVSEPTMVPNPKHAEVVSARDKELAETSKPKISLDLLKTQDLVNSDSPVEFKKQHDEIKEQYLSLQKLIKCLW